MPAPERWFVAPAPEHAEHPEHPATTAAAAIADLVHRYAELVDLGDFAGVGELFAHATYRAALPGGEIITQTGAGEVTRAMATLVTTYDGVPATKHVTTNLIIDVDDGDGTATGRSYFTVFQAPPGGPLRPIIAGRYHDSFERSDRGWRFRDRLIHSDLFGDLSRHLGGDPYRR